MSMICVGDLHLKKTEPYFSAQKQFLNWLNENYSDITLVLIGDIFDSAPHHDLLYEFKSFLKKRNSSTFIIQGNHDFSYKSGLYLKSFDLMDNVFVYFEPTEVFIDKYKCLMLPHKSGDMKTEYESLKGNFDFVFSHITHYKEAFGDEGIDLQIKAKKYLYGHTHTKATHNDHIICGVPIITRNGEFNNPIYEIESNGHIMEIEVPIFLDIQTINYDTNEKILNKSFIYNIKNAPSVKNVYEKFRGYYIRHEGIELKQTLIDSEVKFDFDANDLLKYFKLFVNEKNIGKEHVEKIIPYMS
jgi:predicted phosphodiesterase